MANLNTSPPEPLLSEGSGGLECDCLYVINKSPASTEESDVGKLSCDYECKKNPVLFSQRKITKTPDKIKCDFWKKGN